MNDQVHMKGWEEGTDGKGSGRAISNDDFEAGIRCLKDAGWDFTLTAKENKSLENGELLVKVKDRMNKCCIVVRESIVKWNLMSEAFIHIYIYICVYIHMSN